MCIESLHINFKKFRFSKLVYHHLFFFDHAIFEAHPVLAHLSVSYPRFGGRLPTRYSPVRHYLDTVFIPKESVCIRPFDLHVLSTPPAFVLSQDQTLH